MEQQPEIVEEKVAPKKAKKAKKPQKKVQEKEEDLDAIIKEMGLESRTRVVVWWVVHEDVEETKKAPTVKQNVSLALLLLFFI